MISTSTTQLKSLKAPSRSIYGKVALTQSAATSEINYDDDLIEIKVDRVGENAKFFGFGISQKATVKIRDINRSRNILEDEYIKIYFSIGETVNYKCVTPNLYVKEIERDENTNNITIVAYDRLIKANELTVDDLKLNGAYSFDNLINGIVVALGVSAYTINKEIFDGYLPEVANLSGTETLRAVLDDIAEVSGSIYFINHNNELIFKRLRDINSTSWSIEKSDYFNLTCKNEIKLNSVAHITELGDNSKSVTAGAGETQYMKENCFVNNNSKAYTLVGRITSYSTVKSMYEFNLSWRGNYLLELVDRITIQTKDNSTITTYVINDSYTYNGGFKQETNWSYTASEAVNTNPTTIGEAFNQTSARVDKINKEITLIAAEATEASEKAAALEITVNGIDSTVKDFQNTINGEVTRIDEAITQISQTADEIELSVTTLEENIGKDIDATNKKVAELVLKDDEIALSVTNLATSFGETVEEIYAEIDINTDGINIANSKIDANSEAIGAINVNNESITSTVESIEKNTNAALEGLNEDIITLESKIEQTAKDLKIEFESKITTEADSVTTSTGFTFDSTGLTVEKTGSEIKTQITEDGMKVYRNSTAMLTANNEGVNARNLTATTYLIIGGKSRVETMKNGHTGIFWIG